MSFLNALASDGLSVGLRLYTAKLNNRTSGVAAGEPAEETPALPGLPAPAEESKASGQAASTPLPPLTPEERAAGRAEARAKLAADGSLGQLQASAAPPAAGDEDEPQVGGQGLTPEEEPGEGQTGQAAASAGPTRELTEEEKQTVEKMKQRDREVRAHEQAHVAAASGLAGAPSFEYQTGPDGRRYAVGGEVSVQTSGSSNPDVALREAEAVKRAATAPANPSGQDRAAAASASADITRLQAEKARNNGRDDGQPNDAGNSKPNADASGLAGLNAKPINGSSFGNQVLGAYAAAKFGSAAQAPRQVLARA